MSKQLKLSLVLAFAFGIMVLVLIIISGSRVNARSALITPTSSDPVIQRLSAEIYEYEQTLANTALSPDERMNIEAKLSQAKSELDRRLAEIAPSVDVVALKDTQIAEATQSYPQLVETDVRPTGILDDPPHLEGFQDATFTTVWIAPYGNAYIKVYAGRMLSDPDQGILVIVLESSGIIENYLSPVKEGELRIVNSDQGRLTIRTEKNNTFYFDLDTRLYYDADETPWVTTSTPESIVP